jgi:hypothetical protein
MAPIDDALTVIAGEAKPCYIQIIKIFKIDRNTLARRYKKIITKIFDKIS